MSREHGVLQGGGCTAESLCQSHHLLAAAPQFFRDLRARRPDFDTPAISTEQRQRAAALAFVWAK